MAYASEQHVRRQVKSIMCNLCQPENYDAPIHLFFFPHLNVNMQNLSSFAKLASVFSCGWVLDFGWVGRRSVIVDRRDYSNLPATLAAATEGIPEYLGKKLLPCLRTSKVPVSTVITLNLRSRLRIRIPQEVSLWLIII